MILDEKEYEHIFKTVVASDSGRRFVAYLIDVCDVGHSYITDYQRMDDFNAGKRYVGEQLLKDFKEYAMNDYIEVLKAEYNQQIKEKIKQERNDDNE